MLYHLLDQYADLPGFGVFQYLTFRAILAIIFSLIISLIIGKWLINLLRRKLIGERIRSEGPESHKAKAGTPTMGGLIIMAAIIIPTLLWADLTNIYVLLILLATVWMGIIGFVDDYIKVFKKNKAGLKGKFKIVGQVGIGLIVGIVMTFHPSFMGKKGKVYVNNEIRPTQTLSDAGFNFGDRLIAINGQEFTVAPADVAYGTMETYTVERGSEPGKREIISIRIPAKDREMVGNELFKAQDPTFMTETTMPFLKTHVINYSLIAFWNNDPNSIWGKVIYILIAVFIVTAVSNAVNITDGIDGLAAGTSAITAAALGIFSYISGNIIFTDYLNIEYIPMSGELFIFCAAMIGACVGFLWYNTYPAQVFMGDTGSLMLGGALAVVALMVKKELLIPIMCGVFFVESLSVIAQVSYFKYTKKRYGEGRRIFKMAPLHHHFELKGLHESKIVARFWIVAVFLALIAFATLKLR